MDYLLLRNLFDSERRNHIVIKMNMTKFCTIFLFSLPTRFLLSNMKNDIFLIVGIHSHCKMNVARPIEINPIHGQSSALNFLSLHLELWDEKDVVT